MNSMTSDKHTDGGGREEMLITGVFTVMAAAMFGWLAEVTWKLSYQVKSNTPYSDSVVGLVELLVPFYNLASVVVAISFAAVAFFLLLVGIKMMIYANEDNSPCEGETIKSPFDSEKTVVIKAGGRTWEGSAEEFKTLRDQLNEVEFRD